MRYWHPMSDAVAGAVRAFAPDRVVLLPLYPQYSLTTTGSSLADWTRAAGAAGLVVPATAVCCYPEQPGLVAAIAAGIETALADAAQAAPVRVLFSAHGLPEKTIARGDPYQRQVERTAAALVTALGQSGLRRADLDTVVCYQSRVGPLRWIGPSTEEELARAARDGRAVVVVPIAFVSEHSETLVELDIEYRDLAERLGVPGYRRVPTVGTDPRFIAGLAELVVAALGSGRAISGPSDRAACAASFAQCPCRAGSAAGSGGEPLAGAEA
jgi:ferrochelatase